MTFLFFVLFTNVYMHVDTNKQLIRTAYAVNKLFIEPHIMQSGSSVYYGRSRSGTSNQISVQYIVHCTYSDNDGHILINSIQWC